MAPCTGSTITPKMIRTGKMNIGDRILLEDIVASSPDFQQEPSQKAKNSPQTEETAASRENIQSEVSAEKKADHADDTLVHGPAPVMQHQPQAQSQAHAGEEYVQQRIGGDHNIPKHPVQYLQRRRIKQGAEHGGHGKLPSQDPPSYEEHYHVKT